MSKNVIKIEKLTLRNFKGVKLFEIENPGNEVSIHGDNRTGKTTLATAFVWLLSGKDLQDRKDYEIKTLDKDNNPISQLEHEVSAVINVDGVSHTLKRIYKEKWTKRRGEETAELTGHETSFWWNDVPLKLSEYQVKVEQIFGNETTFKILTNPLFLNEKIKWEERREILMDIVGQSNDLDLMESDKRFSDLMDKLTGKTIKEYEAQVKAHKREIKGQLEVIPNRLDEVDRMMPEAEPDYDKLSAEIQDAETEIKSIEEQIRDKSKSLERFYKVREGWIKSINELKDQIRKEEENALEQSQVDANAKSREAYECKKQIQELQQDIDLAQNRIKSIRKQIEQLKIEQDSLRAEWKREADKVITINESEFECPTCKRAYDAEKAAQMEAEMLANFNKEQAKKLESIQKRGFKHKEDIDKLVVEIKEGEQSIQGLSEKRQNVSEKLNELSNNPATVVSVKDILSDNQEYHKMVERLEQLENEPQKAEGENTSFLESQRIVLRDSIISKREQLTIKDQVEKLNTRKQELKDEEKELVKNLSLLEKDEFLIEQFTMLKVNAIEEKVNKLFPSVKFKLFETQINGGIKETCQTLINGVPFSAANNAAQIQSGMEIIDVLSNHYGKVLPIWIDNAESVTTFPAVKSQLIKLYVDESCKTLTVK